MEFNPFEAFQFKSEDNNTTSTITKPATQISLKSNRITNKFKTNNNSSSSSSNNSNRVTNDKNNFQKITKKPSAVLSLSTEIAIGTSSHYRIIINSLRNWKRKNVNNASTSTVDEFQIFLKELSAVQTNFPFLVLCTGILGTYVIHTYFIRTHTHISLDIYIKTSTNIYIFILHTPDLSVEFFVNMYIT